MVLAIAEEQDQLSVQWNSVPTRPLRKEDPSHVDAFQLRAIEPRPCDPKSGRDGKQLEPMNVTRPRAAVIPVRPFCLDSQNAIVVCCGARSERSNQIKERRFQIAGFYLVGV